MSYPLESLLSLREHRVDEAISDHKISLNKLTQALKVHENAQKELSEFRVWVDGEIERRYQFIINKNLSQKDLSKFKESLSQLSLKELSLEKAVDKAKDEVQKAQKEEKDRKDRVRACNQALAKLQEHKKIYKASERLYEEYRQDLELEDFHVKKKDF